MPTRVEREALQKPPEGVVERPEAPEIPEHIERGGVVKRAVDPSQVYDDSGKPLVEAPQTKIPRVVLPQTEETLKLWEKGSPEDAKTGYAIYWLRRLKKAILKGWETVVKTN